LFLTTGSEKDELLQSIAKKREEMIEIAFQRGFHSKEAVQCSQELDDLLNLYSRLGKETKIEWYGQYRESLRYLLDFNTKFVQLVKVGMTFYQPTDEEEIDRFIPSIFHVYDAVNKWDKQQYNILLEALDVVTSKH
jgi:stage 0 sporulation regulatory protein